MNWNKFTDTLTPYVNKAKEYGQKAAKFAEDQIQTTPLFIKTQVEYEDLLTEKRAIIVAYDENQDDIAKEIRLLSTIWLTRAFMDAAKLRFISIHESAELVQNIGIVGPLDMRIRFEWVEVLHFTDLIAIKKWWQSPYYKKDETEVASKNEEPVDPLAGK
jgi:hypothetical protein